MIENLERKSLPKVIKEINDREASSWLRFHKDNLRHHPRFPLISSAYNRFSLCLIVNHAELGIDHLLLVIVHVLIIFHLMFFYSLCYSFHSYSCLHWNWSLDLFIIIFLYLRNLISLTVNCLFSFEDFWTSWRTFLNSFDSLFNLFRIPVLLFSCSRIYWSKH